MSTELRFDGLDELRAALRKLPAELATEASTIVENAASGANGEIAGKYPVGPTGNLKRGVRVTHADKGKYAAGAILKSNAKHAFIFENGTKRRQTDKGQNRGVMPASDIFVPVVIRWRRRMYEQLKDLLVRNGLVVSGD